MTFEEAKEVMDDAWVRSDGNLHKFIEFLKEKEKDTDEYEMRKNDARHGRKEEEPAQTTDKPIDRTRLKDSEKQFNDALLDEQAKRIENQKKVIGMLQDKLAETDGNYKYTLEKYTDFQKKVKEMGKQIAHLNEVIGKKNAQIKDYKIACEEHDEQLKDYMLSDKKKDDMISGLKKVNEGLRHKLADAVISKVNENALKSAESALVYKDKVIDELKKKISDAAGILTGSDGLRIIWSESDPIEDFFKFVSEYGRTE